MTFREWWFSYDMPLINGVKQFDILQKATRAAYNAGKRAGRKEEGDKWRTRQSNLSASSGARRSTGG